MDADGLAALARRHGVRLVVRFGSTVTGSTHAGSDLDLGVVTDRAELSFNALMDLTSDLQAFGNGREVDVAVLNHADPLFLKQVADNCERVFGSPDDVAAFKLRAFHRYQDYSRYLVLEQAFVDRRLGAATS